MAQIEPMEIDSLGSDFDDKENSVLNSNVFSRTPCTEKGYEELDVSELNMKLRYSITPASSPMSKSYTASCKDNITYSINEDSLNSTIVNNNTNLTRSLNSSITKCDIASKSPKLPLQALPTDQYLDINSTIRRSLDNDPNNITITINGNDNVEENLSLPSTSSSAVQTPEATTPTKEIPKDGGSPIMRGLKSVLNMFRSSQSPIPPEDNTENKDPVMSHLEEEQIKSQTVLASTPKTNDKNKDNNSSKRSSPLKDSVVFNDDLERELQWKDETTIIFKEEKMPIHKLFLQQTTCMALDKKIPPKVNDCNSNLNSTVEYMDISYNETGIGDQIMTDIESKINVNNIEAASGVESDGEFLDCETTYTKNEQIDSEQVNKTIPNNIEKKVTEDIHDDNNTSQINEQKAANMDGYSEVVSTNVSSFGANVQLEEKENVFSVLNDVESDNKLANVSNEHVPDVPIEIQKESCQKDEIDVNKDNVTTVLDVLANELESNNHKDQPDILIQHDIDINEIETSEFEKECNLSNTFNRSMNEEIIDTKCEEQLTFDVTKPLNIVTDDYDNILVNENSPSNNFVLVDKENVELNENNSQTLNSRILQICENVSGNTIHDHENNTLNTLDFNSNTFNLEENIITNDEIIKYHNENSEDNTTSPLLKNGESKEALNSIDKEVKNIESDKVELSSLNHTIDIPYLNNQSDFKNIEISSFNLNNTEIQNNDDGIIESTPTTNDLEHNNSQNIENNAQVCDLPVGEFINNLPSDIPLPSDDDIEKDSLMDNFIIKNDDVEDLDVKILDCIIKDETIDSLEAMDVVSQEAITTNSEHSNDRLPNIDHIQSATETIKENISNSPSLNCDILINKSEILLEPVSQDLADNKTVLPDIISKSSQHHQSLNTEIINDAGSVSVAGHIDHVSINNDSQNVEDKKFETLNCNKVNEEHTNDISIDAIGLKENKLLDEEIVTSANNSPYISVNDLDLNIPKNDIKMDEIETPFEIKSKIAMSPPISPKLSKKGYNINFDEIDDPFATKTNIRMSPTPEASPKKSSMSINIGQKKPDIQKTVQQQNRRKSQPVRQKRDLTKKRFNSSYNCDTRNTNCKEPIDTPINENDNKKLIDENIKINLNCTVTTSAVEVDNGDTKDMNKCEVDNFNISNKILSNAEETLTIKDESVSFNIEPAQENSTAQNTIKDNISPKRFSLKNVFNLPEIDDMNFNPFVSKSKIRNSPSPTFEKESALLKENKINSDSLNEIKQRSVANLTANIEKSTHEDKVDSSDLSSETCSSKNTDKEFTVREIATEDEDTAEGPFLEAEEFADVVKVSDFGTETDMMQFEDLHTHINKENKDEGELFIDAEAFEFLLNQNKSNVVADSGKESLFLKFDPLFAKRVSSDGVLAALNRIQKRQSTPKKVPETSKQSIIIDEEMPSVSSTNVGTVLEESSDETNITVTKPMMVVNPAINSLVSPRKSTTPPRINRRSLTFTSPAMAVIDRLLSLSGNSSTLDHDTSLPRTNREYNETDVALTQLRELLAEKEINVHNLRTESKELKERLATMESQMKTLEKESKERLKKVNDLNDRLTEKAKINKSMAIVVEEYERTIASLISEMEQEKRRNAEERAKLIGERDEQTAHLASMEVSFSDLHSKYEKSKQIILSMKANEDTYRKSIKEFEDNLLKMQNNYELLKQHATSKLNHANQELEKFNRAHESEVLKLNAMVKRKELHITSLEESLAQKTKANEELTAICDELINKVG